MSLAMGSSDIVRITRPINQVNDSVIGGVPMGAASTTSGVGGQLGKTIWLDQGNVIYTASVGTVYGGRFRYVRLRAADTPAIVIGQILLWDTTITNWSSMYQVTRESDMSSVSNDIMIAGVAISIPTAGNYFWIQDMGQVNVKFQTTLTTAGQIGSRVFAGGGGDGADEGLADVLGPASAANISDVSLMQARYLGTAVTAPVALTLSPVILAFKNILG